MKTITKNQYYQLVGLTTLAKINYDALTDIERAMCEITGQEPNSGSMTGDIVYQSRELDDGLRILEIKVCSEASGDVKP